MDCPTIVLTLLRTFPGFPQDTGIREEITSKENLNTTTRLWSESE